MTETRSRNDSSRDLLEELEDGWASTERPSSKEGAVPAASTAPVDPDSVPDVNDLDEGWLDKLFPEDDDEEEEEDESEPELPDERLDPEAFAAAKKALAERQAAKKEKKKQKLEAKRARQRAKAIELKKKQKGKAKRKAAPPSTRRPDKIAKAERKKNLPAVVEDLTAEEAAALDGVEGRTSRRDQDASPAPSKKKSIAPAPRKPDTMQSIKLLAIVLAVLLAIGIAVAVIAR